MDMQEIMTYSEEEAKERVRSIDPGAKARRVGELAMQHLDGPRNAALQATDFGDWNNYAPKGTEVEII